VDILDKLAIVCERLGQFEKAVPVFHRALAICEGVYGPEHIATAAILDHLACSYNKSGQHEKALPLYQRLVSIQDILMPVHAGTANSLMNLAGVYQALGHLEQAVQLYQRALAMNEEVLGTDHYATNQCESNLAVLYHTLGQYDKALPLSSGLFQYALALNEQGEYSKAFYLLQRDLAIRDKGMGPEHVDTAFTLYHLARTYVHLDQPHQAVPLLQRALAIREKALESDDPSAHSNLDLHIVMTVKELAKVHEMLGQYDKSLHSITAYWASRKKKSA
jgi:tetratricopeptide (TPR) repeat protein